MFNWFNRNKLAPAAPTPVNVVEELLKDALRNGKTGLHPVQSGLVVDPSPALAMFNRQPSESSTAYDDYSPIQTGYVLEWIDKCATLQIVFVNRRTAFVWDGNVDMASVEFLETSISSYIHDTIEAYLDNIEMEQELLRTRLAADLLLRRLNIGTDCVQ